MELISNSSQIRSICIDNDISYLALFGSYARGEQADNSDVDLLVEYSKPKSMFDHVRIQRQFEKALNKKVDLVTKRALHPYIRDYVYKDLKVMYAER
ncbi:TPA: hypothetical protein DCY43_02095 [candidate division WWE3 bacterium]|uniref:Polymerase, beta domain protein region protein n=3 Tax=Katanobacteria TaxID=422282 RepID=A0A0G1KL21_UNCKA|nr:MAG: polymerase, beta domain protein region protein [candidate division WWE3 bacterium GW2011_GWA2_44_16]KKT84218.1 MAG: polymerase, beta domain protein region protein [candidate division WWE3 bacterium GW2011_GWC2_44_9]HAZ29523.1 hypothetical protein [candidate division WWE3 bacterium]